MSHQALAPALLFLPSRSQSTSAIKKDKTCCCSSTTSSALPKLVLRCPPFSVVFQVLLDTNQHWVQRWECFRSESQQHRMVRLLPFKLFTFQRMTLLILRLRPHSLTWMQPQFSTGRFPRKEFTPRLIHLILRVGFWSLQLW